MSISYLEVACEDVWEAGHIYVAMSRGCTLQGLTVHRGRDGLCRADARVVAFMPRVSRALPRTAHLVVDITPQLQAQGSQQCPDSRQCKFLPMLQHRLHACFNLTSPLDPPLETQNVVACHALQTSSHCLCSPQLHTFHQLMNRDLQPALVRFAALIQTRAFASSHFNHFTPPRLHESLIASSHALRMHCIQAW